VGAVAPVVRFGRVVRLLRGGARRGVVPHLPRPDGWQLMRVRVSFTVDIDAEAWAETYGLTKAEVRADVQDYARHEVLDQLMTVGMLTAP